MVELEADNQLLGVFVSHRGAVVKRVNRVLLLNEDAFELVAIQGRLHQHLGVERVYNVHEAIHSSLLRCSRPATSRPATLKPATSRSSRQTDDVKGARHCAHVEFRHVEESFKDFVV